MYPYIFSLSILVQSHYSIHTQCCRHRGCTNDEDRITRGTPSHKMVLCKACWLIKAAVEQRVQFYFPAELLEVS